MQDLINRQAAIDARRYKFGNDEFSLESAYHDCKLVFDGITDDDSFQEADTGLILYYANEIIYALQKALEGKNTNVPSNDVISRKAAIDALDSIGSLDTDADREYAREVFEALPSAQPDLITKIQNGIKVTDADDVYSCGMRNGMRWCISLIDDKEPLYENCPSAQPEITEEQAIEHLQSTGWMQKHDRILTESTWDIIRCKDCKHWLPHYQLGYDEDNNEYHDYCGKLIPEDEYYAFYRNADDFCSRAERR